MSNGYLKNYIQPHVLSYSPGDGTNSSFGHMVYNYITGLLFSKEMGMQFVHCDLSGYAERFNSILNLKNNFKTVDQLPIKKIVKIDKYNFREDLAIERCANEIRSHAEQGILFRIDFDKGNLFPGRLIKDSEWLVEVFSNLYFKNNNKLEIFKPSHENICVHIRRGDITESRNPDRWETEEYYTSIIDKLDKKENVKFFIISDGVPGNFTHIRQKYDDLNIIQLSSFHNSNESIFNQIFDSKYNLILGGKDTEIFHMFSQSDVLVTGQSSFSTLCSYINKGKIIYTKCKEYTDFENFKDKRFINALNL